MSLLPTPLRRLSPEPFPELSPELSDSDDLTSVSYLYCDEDRFEETDEGEVLDPLDRLSFHDDDDDDEELCSLFVKERSVELKKVARSPAARRRAVEWIVKVNSHYGFSTLTAVLAINYLDRFIAGPCYEKPWTIQLVAVGCLSLAAKVEETDVPLLLDLQIEETSYLFEAKTIQRAELLILSELGWRMHPVTPISFMDHIVERMRLKGNAHWDFLSRCHRLLLCLLSDARSVRYRPSVLATATVMHVIDQADHLNSIDSQAQLLSVLNISKDKVKECYELIMEAIAAASVAARRKRKYCSYDEEEEEEFPSSPSGVIDAANTDAFSSSSSSSSSESSADEHEHQKKKSRSQEEDQWVLLGFIGSRN